MTEIDPPYLWPDYRSTAKRAPSRPLLPLPRSSTGSRRLSSARTRSRRATPTSPSGHAGEPLGERIIVHGRVVDEDGRPVPNVLLEVWQANAAGRYHHERRPSSGAARPELHRCRAAANGRRRAATGSSP